MRTKWPSLKLLLTNYPVTLYALLFSTDQEDVFNESNTVRAISEIITITFLPSIIIYPISGLAFVVILFASVLLISHFGRQQKALNRAKLLRKGSNRLKIGITIALIHIAVVAIQLLIMLPHRFLAGLTLSSTRTPPAFSSVLSHLPASSAPFSASVQAGPVSSIR